MVGAIGRTSRGGIVLLVSVERVTAGVAGT
jgi:hypothetical protein